ncbi:gem-associated protein 6 isoform X2 [Petromyzon marinus]|nr:gem-associated protein 6 isoform X2 [Petromyzon marinus]
MPTMGDAAKTKDACEVTDAEVRETEGNAMEVVAETDDEVGEVKEGDQAGETRGLEVVEETKAWSELSPLRWQELLHRHVRVCADEGVQREGWVYTVDPVSASIMLVTQPSPGSPELTLCTVMGHAVRSVVETRAPGGDAAATSECPSMLFRPAARHRPSLGAEEVASRRQALLVWLRRNHVPVEERGDELLVAGGVLSVAPPYGPDDCSSANEIILERVRRLVQARLSEGREPETNPA